MYKYGIRGLPAKLLQSYLTNRVQVTKINNSFSSIQQVTCGVPQGSILGPLLFNLYINDLPKASKFSIRLFADDACLTLRHKNPDTLESLINQELNTVNNWMSINKLSVNYTKTNYVIFTKNKSQKQYNIYMNDKLLESVDEIRYLGVHIDKKLDWKIHINKIKSKLTSASYILSKMRHYADAHTLKLLYYCLAYPYLNYCVTAWCGAPKSILQPLIRLENKIIRIITNNNYTSPTKPIFLTLKTLPFNLIYTYNLSILMYKIQNPIITGSYNLLPLEQRHNYNTRLVNSQNYFQNFHRTNLGKSTSSAKGITVWRNVPSEFKSLPLFLFKNKIKQYLINSLNE